MWPFSRHPVVPVLRFSGPIGLATPLRPGLTLSSAAQAMERAFSASRLPTVAVAVNSPGGSAVQSSLLFKRLRQLAEEKNKRIIVFCEDVAASGGYYLALAGDEIYADAASIVGSIGVISASFGLHKAIDRLGIERRVYTAGDHKGALDPFLPERPEEIERLKAIQRDVHDVFIGIVKDRRAGRLKAPDAELFSGAFWSAAKALDLGLIDGVADVRSKMRELHGPKVVLRAIPIASAGWLARLRRLPSIGHGPPAEGIALALADDLVSALEARALWARYGL
ncbi:MAG TPA: S49 family peptidase [Hyphomicrobiaceae bacterium]|nr:S49 family peptidase [Hyphomicrobiaceae bacterium]